MDIQKVRSNFPALSKEQVFLDNAGGSQVLGTVIDSYVRSPIISCLLRTHRKSSFFYRIRDYLINSNVQLGATYTVGKQATSVRARNNAVNVAGHVLIPSIQVI